MNVPVFITDYWAVILVGIFCFLGVVLKLKKLWRGNLIEWLIEVCAIMEKEFGEKTGYLKLRGAYNEFVATFPMFSKFVSFRRFSVLVDEALDDLKQILATNKAIGRMISNHTEKSEHDEEKKQ